MIKMIKIFLVFTLLNLMLTIKIEETKDVEYNVTQSK